MSSKPTYRDLEKKVKKLEKDLLKADKALTLRNEATSARSEAIENAKVLVGEVGEKFAGNIKVELEGALDTAHTLAQTLSGIKDENNPIELGREEVNSILTIILDRNPQFVGTYTAWEINEFDDMDSGYLNDAGHDPTGRFPIGIEMKPEKLP